MRDLVKSIFAVIALFGAAFSITPALSQTEVLKNPQVEIEYVAPRSERFQAIYDRLKTLQVLEMLQEFLAPLRLPKTLKVKTDECGALEVVYKPQEPVIICYEYVRAIERSAPGSKIVRIGSRNLTKESIVVGGFVNAVLYRVSYAVLDLLEIPIWGREDDAADAVAAVVMLEFQTEAPIVITTLLGTSWFLAQRSFSGGGGDFVNVRRSDEAQRYFNYTCMAFGAYPDAFRFLVTNQDLPKERAASCGIYYSKLLRSFRQTIIPYVDQDMLKKVRAIDWAARLKVPVN